jgi:pyruvate/2-oxoacid:ferredoxin oxidoreductase alpha subunit/NAD-dependent dihydropyrimidine dehydrogenase PreA subunit
LSVAIGASAAGARAYTATASQGLLFMAEAVYNASGLGLPIVMTLGNRAIGAPINIWNDHSDAMSMRDAGWLQLFAETNQEAVDLHIQAFKLAEELSMPVMVCVDGFILTHAVERVQVGANMMTGVAGIFAGGDMVPSERTVTVAVGHGKKAARHIDAWLRATAYAPAQKHEIASADKLNTWYYGEAPKTLQPVLEMARRTSTFEEVVKGLDESNALYEARRCISCGNCFECDNCYGVCPDNAVIKLGPGMGFEFNLDYCKGCGICAQECPCGAIQMIPEAI